MYLHEGISYRKLADEKGLLLSYAVFNTKVLKYQEHGLADIQTRRKNSHYSKKFKDSLVGKYMEKGLPIRILARKYNIPTHGTIRTCVINYTKGEDLKLILPNPRYIQWRVEKLRTEIEALKAQNDTLKQNKVRRNGKRFDVTQTHIEQNTKPLKTSKAYFKCNLKL